MLNISAFSVLCVLLKCYCNITFQLYNCHFIYLFIALFYFVSLFNMHVLIVLEFTGL